MNRPFGALLLAALPLAALAQPAPPTLKDLPPVPAAPAPEAAASEPLKRRCVAGCDGKSARVSWTEDASNRFEEHRDESGRLVRFFVHPKNGMPRYEVLMGAERNKSPATLPRNRHNQSNGTTNSGAPEPVANQAVWEIKKF